MLGNTRHEIVSARIGKALRHHFRIEFRAAGELPGLRTDPGLTATVVEDILAMTRTQEQVLV